MIILRKYMVKFIVLLLLSLFFLGLSVRYASLTELTENSHLIVHGKVDSYYSVWEENNIYTYIKIDIYESLKGSEKNKQIMIKQLGGTVGDISQEISGTPKLWQDSEVFLFLVNWKGAYWIHSVILGYYEVVEVNGTKYAVNNFNNVELLDAKTGKPIEDKRHIKTNYELSSFKSEINGIVRGGQK